MHTINGLELATWSKERYTQLIAEAQRDLHAQAIARAQNGDHLAWLRTLLPDWASRNVLPNWRKSTDLNKL
jgi:hypothetical protein